VEAGIVAVASFLFAAYELSTYNRHIGESNWDCFAASTSTVPSPVAQAGYTLVSEQFESVFRTANYVMLWLIGSAVASFFIERIT
jgi:hypothetical protein